MALDEGVEKYMNKALEWYTLSADHGYADAQKHILDSCFFCRYSFGLNFAFVVDFKSFENAINKDMDGVIYSEYLSKKSKSVSIHWIEYIERWERYEQSYLISYS